MHENVGGRGCPFGVCGGPVGAFECGYDSSALCACGTSDGAPCGRTGRRSGLKKQKGRPKAAAIDDDYPFLPHLFFRCRIVHEVSADFFRTPSPQGGGGDIGALGVDTRGQSGENQRLYSAGVENDSLAPQFPDWSSMRSVSAVVTSRRNRIPSTGKPFESDEKFS